MRRTWFKSNYDQFVKESSNLVFFWFYGVTYFFLFRLLFWSIFNKQISSSTVFKDYVIASFVGFRFDCMLVSYFIIIPLAILLLVPCAWKVARKIRIIMQYLFVILSTLICMVTLNYFAEYNDQFNNFLFMGLFDEDKVAVAKSIWKDCNPWLNIICSSFVIFIGILIFKKLEKSGTIASLIYKLTCKSFLKKIIFVVTLIICFIFSLRGSITSIMGRRSAAVSTDNFLNKTVINPFRMLKYAYKDYKSLNSIGDKNPYGDIDTIDLEETVGNVELVKVVSNGMDMNHKQIFLIIMESYDAWPLMDKYKELNVASNLREIAGQGTHFTNFLPAYNATFYAVATIMSSIPYAGVDISTIAPTFKRYDTSIFNQFKELGYGTKFFYGGYPSWHNIDNFVSHLGCDSLYYANSMGSITEFGEWGVNDEILFDQVLDNVDSLEKTLNIVLTTSYHSPFEVDVSAKGFPYEKVYDLPESMKDYYDGSVTLNQLGHLWYGDMAIGKFMEKAKEKYPDALFVFTGDHYSRNFLNAQPSLLEKSCVPLILYGKGIPSQRLDTPGDHSDIIATLVDLESKPDYSYSSFGKSMFSKDKKFGQGFKKIITRDNLYVLYSMDGVYKMTLNNGKVEYVNKFPYQELYFKYLKIAWQYGAKGSFKDCTFIK